MTMVEFSNNTLALLSLALLGAVVAATLFIVSDRDQYYSVTGHATSDTGYVNLTIDSVLAIAVDTTNSTIMFGACVPQGAVSYWCATNDTAVCSGTPNNGNCSGDTTTPQFIRIDNVGNVDANVTVQSECNATGFIGGTNPAFQYITTACNGTGVSSWTNFSSVAYTTACSNLSYLGGRLRLYSNVTIPNNAVGGTGGCSNQSTLTFSAVVSP